MSHSKPTGTGGAKLIGARQQSHGDTIEELSLSLDNMNEVFVKMRDAVMAEVKDANGHTRIVLCRETPNAKSVLLLEPLNERATAEALTLKSFATRYSQVTVSYNTPKS